MVVLRGKRGYEFQTVSRFTHSWQISDSVDHGFPDITGEDQVESLMDDDWLLKRDAEDTRRASETFSFYTQTLARELTQPPLSNELIDVYTS